ncbi:NHLP bacteriocin export ABC transporter permease/ATPase subunit [Emergencia timonensis]|uniref:NHLP bacteriocin export ABC transporter permease/ATPase subunit n=1 Tax=Emergencia timonensis TaxID=1776384 RepID=UPI003993C914
MSWFGEQLEERKTKDNELFEGAFQDLSSVVMPSAGRQKMEDSIEESQSAIEAILKYLHVKIAEVPEEIKDLNDQIEYMLRPTGVMRRRVELTDTWYKDSINPILAAKKDGTVVALLPSRTSGYSYFDKQRGRRIRVTKKVAEDFETDAYCFYRAFPLKSLNIKDLVVFMAKSLSFWDYAYVAALTLAVSLIGLITPYATQMIFSSVIPAGVSFYVLPMAILVVTSLVASNLFGICNTVLDTKIEKKLSVAVKSASMARLLLLPAGFFKSYSSGELSKRLESMDILTKMLQDTIMNTGLTAVFSIVYVVQITRYSKALAVAAVAILLLNLVYTMVSSILQLGYSRKRLAANAKLSGMVFALFSGIQKIKLSGSEKRMFGRWAKTYKTSADLEYNPPIIIRLAPVFTVIFTFGNLLVLYYIAAVTGVSAADYMAFTTSYGLVSTAIMGLSSITNVISDIKPAMEMVEPIMKTMPEVEENKKAVTKLNGSIELSNISFQYSPDGPKIIDNLSLKIRPNQYVAIVGKTGCGKSTLMRILLGFEKPQTGSVYFDGKDLDSLDVKSVRRNIGVVMQNSSLFAGDIYSNIVVSAPWLGLEDAWEAARMAGIAEDIQRMPMNMHTVISEGSGGISGGQKQRIMIARAIAPKPKIIMFDEATSALDNITQKQVSESLSGLRSTRIVIAHRLSTIKQCDRIIYLEDGKIAEDGTFDQLVALNGKFAELVRRQMI